MTEKMTLLHVGAGLAIGLAGIGSGIWIGLIGQAWLNSLWRNPDGSKAFFVPAILALALCESVAIYGFVIAFMVLNSAS